LVPGSQVTITFKDDNLSASAGCNAMGGTYSLDGAHLTTGQMMTTEMGCAAPLMAQDQWLGSLLADVTLVQDGPNLTMTQGSTTLTLLDKTVATPDLPLEGTLWVLETIVQGDAASSVPVGVVASIRIVGAEMAVDTGCNTGRADVAVTPDSLTFGPMLLTKKACEGGAGMVEGAMTQVLDGTVVYEIEADRLVVNPRADGLVFRAQP
jgi:heat shock protein HslJ